MIEALGQLGLKGMAAAFDDAVTTGLQRNRTALEMLADLLKAETAHADSDDAAHLFRSDRAHHSELMPPGRECLIDGLVCH
ncbi:hypothetical protein V5F44_01925 [Xanthobacter sp. V2C-8]|uniref:hypothetical protein n=1 Tax=Xanthobacter albus TaxID=3119929 RepID=UPI00372BB8E8